MTFEDARREFRIARTKVQHGLLLGAVLAAIGLAIIAIGAPAIPDAALVGGVNLLIGAGILVSVVRAARDPRPRMVLDRRGIWYRDWGIGTVPWPEVADAAIGGPRLRSFLGVKLCDPDGFLARLPEDERAKLRSGRLHRAPELRIPNGALDAPLDEILKAIRQHLAEHAVTRAPVDGSPASG
ncbi:MAG: hypothetical protein ACE5GS_14355 [Kiloniellaceae bacterium]